MKRCFDILRDFRWVPFLLLGILTLILIRPHGDTFTALDHSGYRLMAYAFAQGRGFHEVDQVLEEVPPGARRGLMLLPHMDERNTRDRSFLVRKLDTPQTEPFFYPLLPLLAAGLEKLLPGIGMDLAVPFAGVVFFGVLAWLGWRYGRAWGVGVAVTLAVGSPLPLWLFRGFYVEAMGAACIAAAICCWYCISARMGWRFVAGLLAGLAVSFHPVFVVIALPLVIMLALDPDASIRTSLATLVGFGCGFAVLLMMTTWICSPYGQFSLDALLFGFKASASHRLPHLFVMGAAVLFLVGVTTRWLWRDAATRMGVSPIVRLALMGLASLPLIYAGVRWSNAGLVRHGIMEAWFGMRLPLGILLGIGGVGTIFSKKQTKPFLLLLIFMISLPMFVYLKGAEQMGMWSQRRLLPAYTLLVLGVLPWLAATLPDAFDRLPTILWKRIGGAALALGLLVAGGSNLVRWPAPYLVRVDAGALSFVEEIKAEIGDRLTMFDYQPFSFPFAVDNRTRVIGIGQYEQRFLPPVASWLAERARAEDVLWTTAFSNPGMEDGVLLETLSVHTGSFARVASRGLLPAERRQHDIRLALMRAVPIEEPSVGIVVDKVLNAGPLALREPWGQYRRTLRDDAGQVLPVEWSRNGSGLVGPVPPRGGYVQFEIWAASGQDVPQVLEIVVPWSAPVQRVEIAPAFSHYTLSMKRPIDCEWTDATGVYRLNVPEPYNPAESGIRGFANDLGILAHRIRIETTK